MLHRLLVMLRMSKVQIGWLFNLSVLTVSHPQLPTLTSEKKMVLPAWVTLGILATLARADFYVSLSGSDSAAGTLHAPFKTFERAQKAVRGVVGAMEKDVKVLIAPGTYYLDEPLLFTDLDSGCNGHRVIWEAQDLEKGVNVSGGYVFPFSLVISRYERPQTHNRNPAPRSPTGPSPTLAMESTLLQLHPDSGPDISSRIKNTLNGLITLSIEPGSPTIPKATG